MTSEQPASDQAHSAREGHPNVRFHTLVVTELAALVTLNLWTHSKALTGPHLYGEALALVAGDSLGGLAVFTLKAILTLVVLFHAYKALCQTSPVASDKPQRVISLRGVALAVTAVFAVCHLIWFSYPVTTGNVMVDQAYDHVSSTLSSTWHGLPLVAWSYALGLGALTGTLCFSVHDWLDRVAASAWSARWRGVFVMACAIPTLGLGLACVTHFATGWPAPPPETKSVCGEQKNEPDAP